jgi:hypothetical protein
MPDVGPIITPADRPTPRLSLAMWALVVTCVAALILTVLSQMIFVTRLGRWTRPWREVVITGYSREVGHAFIARTDRPWLSSQEHPSPAFVLEDGRWLGPSNAVHADIRQIGLGRFSFWSDVVYFSTSDNSDPRTNGRRYAIVYPPISRGTAHAIFGVTAVMDLVAFVFTAIMIRTGALGAAVAALVAQLRLVAVPAFVARVGPIAMPILVATSCGGLIAVTVVRALPSIAAFAIPMWVGVLAFNVLTALAVWLRHRSVPQWRICVPFLLAVAAGYYVLTVHAPDRSQGCHTTAPASLWDGFCVSPDSGSYFVGYFPGSTRQPLYSWFIEAVTTGSGFDAHQYLASSPPPGTFKTAPGDPLFRVEHVQIVVMLMASLAACYALMQFTASLWPAAVFLVLYDLQFFSNTELNTILTEPLVLTFVFLVLAAFFGFLREPRRWLLFAGTVACGLAYLTRQASAFSGIFVAVMVLRALAFDWRRWWRPAVVACGLFLALVFVPDVYTFVKLGSLTKQQDSLQYQYRIAHALQYATPADLDLMPDAHARQWLSDAIVRRDREHAAVDRTFPNNEFYRMIYYINQNLYGAAIPVGQHVVESPEFFMTVATPVLRRHWTEYVRFAFRFWQYGLSSPSVARVGIFGVDAWLLYAALAVAMLVLRGAYAIAIGSLVAAHWAHVALASLFAAPIPRMVGATEFLVFLAVAITFWGVLLRLIAAAGFDRAAHLRQPGKD